MNALSASIGVTHDFGTCAYSASVPSRQSAWSDLPDRWYQASWLAKALPKAILTVIDGTDHFFFTGLERLAGAVAWAAAVS